MHPVHPMSNGGIGNGIMDASGTINPAALNPAGTSRAFLTLRARPPRSLHDPIATRCSTAPWPAAHPLHPLPLPLQTL